MAGGISALHGVKDLDVWTFFGAIPGQRFPADKRETHADFGPSELGRQLYDYRVVTEYKRRRFERWERYAGRRVDLLMRALPEGSNADPAESIRAWLPVGASRAGRNPPSPWYLAQKSVVMIDPATRRGEIIWRPMRLD